MPMATVVSTVAGVILISIGLVDLFQTLLRPGGTGRLSLLVFRSVWRLVNGRPPRMAVAGPLTILAVVTIWVLLITVGWALIYLPHMPAGFSYSGVDPARYPPFAEAMTFSLVTLTTVGYGDGVAVDPAIRAVAPLEAFTGFALLTAAVSWFLQIYPALARRRSFAVWLTGMGDAGMIGSLRGLPAAQAGALVDEAIRSLSDLIADLAQNSETFYFRERDPRMSLPRAAEHLLTMRDESLAASDDTLRRRGDVLARQLDVLTEFLRDQYPHVQGESTDAVLSHVADSHGHAFRGA